MKKLMLSYIATMLQSISPSPKHILVNKTGEVQYVQPQGKQDRKPIYDSHHIDVYFSPDDDVRQKLIDAIDAEQSYMHIAIFTLTDKRIAKALLKAHRRGIDISILTDPTCLKDRFNKINFLSQSGVPVYMYNIAHNKTATYSCMHHKFAIFGCNSENKRYVWTGSFNFTKSASDVNQENVVVIHNRTTVDRFEQQFQKIKNRSSKLITNH